MHDRRMKVVCARCDWQETLPRTEIPSHCPVCEFPVTINEFARTEDTSDSLDIASTDDAMIRCRKCQFVQPIGDRACHRCGLLFSVAQRLPSTFSFDGLPESRFSETLRDQWRSIEDALDDETAHEKFIDLCDASGQIQFAGYCYRTALADAETPEVIAHLKSYQAKVIKRATAVMVANAPIKSESRFTHQLIMLSIGALLVLGLAFLYYKWSQSSALLQGIP